MAQNTPKIIRTTVFREDKFLENQLSFIDIVRKIKK